MNYRQNISSGHIGIYNHHYIVTFDDGALLVADPNQNIHAKNTTIIPSEEAKFLEKSIMHPAYQNRLIINGKTLDFEMDKALRWYFEEKRENHGRK